MYSSYFPEFSPDLVVTDTYCKQDKIELSIGQWYIDIANDTEAALLIRSLGAPAPLYRNGKRLRQRESFDETNGWLFNRIKMQEMPDKEWPETQNTDFRKNVKVRTEPLTICAEGASHQIIQPPLFGGQCHWHLTFIGGRTPFRLSARLDLSINPSRYFFHQAVRPHAEREPLEAKMQPRDYWQRFKPPYGEFSWNGADNWLPQSGRLLSHLKEWWRLFSQYLTEIEEVFEAELTRVARSAWRREETHTYNIRKIETYVDLLSDNPLALVDGLEPCLNSFSPSGASNRKFETIESGVYDKVARLRTQTARGEELKIYSKTNRRVRMEVTHNFHRDNRFQFPRVRGETNSSSHKFDSIPKVIGFVQRLQGRAIEVINEFLSHTKSQKRRSKLQTPLYNTLLHVLYCLPRDYETARTLVSMLVHQQRIVVSPKASEEFRNGVKALVKDGIIEKGKGRMLFVARGPYRDAFSQMAHHGWLDENA